MEKKEAFSNKKLVLREEDIIERKGVNKEKNREKGLMGRYSRVKKWEVFSNKKLGLREEDTIKGEWRRKGNKKETLK